MSAVLIALEEHRCRVATDTLQWHETTGAPAALTDRKAWISDNGEFVVAHRGLVAVGEFILPTVLASESLSLALAAATVAQNAIPAGMLDHMGDQVFIAGYDAAEGRARAWEGLRKSSGERSQARELKPGLHLYPKPPLGVPISDGGDLSNERLMKHARAQQLFSRKMNGRVGSNMAIGGICVLHSVTPDGAAEAELGQYGDYTEQAARFGCPRRGTPRKVAEDVA